MATLSTQVALTTIQAAYGHSLEQVREQLQPLALVSEYKDVVKAIATCRTLRVHVEERRKLLKADSLEYGRNVDNVAKQLTEAIASFEEPLKMRKADVDAAKAREKAAKEQAEREQREQEARARIETEQAEARARMAAEQEELGKRRAEIEKLKRQAEAEAATQRAELEALRAQVAQERAAAGAEAAKAAEELRALKQEREAAQTRARLAAEAEEQRLALEAHERELEAKRLAAMPDIERMHAWADIIGGARTNAPSFTTPAARALAESVCHGLSKLTHAMASFDGVSEAP